MSDSKLDSRPSKWDASRFLTTLGHFGEIPFLGSFRWLQKMMGQDTVVPGISVSADKKVAVIGELSSDCLVVLRERLVPTVSLTFIKSDTTFSDLKRLIRSVDVVIVLGFRTLEACAADMANLSVTDFLDTVFSSSGSRLEKVEQLVIDFADPHCDLSAWGALDDVVMGGVSEGSFFIRRLDELSDRAQHAIFAGNISTDNSGGFSSVRTKNFEPPFNFLGWTGMRLRVKGDGQRYKFILRNSSGWDSPAYIYSFDTVADEWKTVYAPFAEMVPTFRAKSVPDAPQLNPQSVFSLQLMLSKFEYDQRLNPSFSSGSFELAIAEIGVYRPRQGVPLLIVSAGGDAASECQETLATTSASYQLIEVPVDADDEMRVEAIAKALL